MHLTILIEILKFMDIYVFILGYNVLKQVHHIVKLTFQSATKSFA